VDANAAGESGVMDGVLTKLKSLTRLWASS